MTFYTALSLGPTLLPNNGYCQHYIHTQVTWYCEHYPSLALSTGGGRAQVEVIHQHRKTGANPQMETGHSHETPQREVIKIKKSICQTMCLLVSGTMWTGIYQGILGLLPFLFPVSSYLCNPLCHFSIERAGETMLVSSWYSVETVRYSLGKLATTTIFTNI